MNTQKILEQSISKLQAQIKDESSDTTNVYWGYNLGIRFAIAEFQIALSKIRQLETMENKEIFL